MPDRSLAEDLSEISAPEQLYDLAQRCKAAQSGSQSAGALLMAESLLLRLAARLDAETLTEIEWARIRSFLRLLAASIDEMVSPDLNSIAKEWAALEEAATSH